MSLALKNLTLLVIVLLALLLVVVYKQQLALVEASATTHSGDGYSVDLLLERQRNQDLAKRLEEAGNEAARLRLETENWQRLCISPAGSESEQAAERGAGGQPAGGVRCSPEPEREECEVRTFYAQPNEPLSEVTFMRAYLEKVHGWRQAKDPEVAAFVLTLGESISPAVKRPCGEELEGMRISGNFGRELEVCQKHKLFVSMSDHWARRGLAARREDTSASEVRETGLPRLWPWLPPTYLLDRPEEVAALNRTVPCEGLLAKPLIVKGDAHGGRAVWFVNSSEELRSLVGLPCSNPGSSRGAEAPPPDYPPRLVQEVIRSVLWDGASVMARVFLLVLRKGRTRLNPSRGKWSLGFPAPSYELHLYDTALFTQYPGNVRDSASEEQVIRRNASELEAFIQEERQRRGLPRMANWVEDYFMATAGEIATEAFAASGAPWPMDLPQNSNSLDGLDLLKAAVLEPDGSWLFVAQELMIDTELKAQLIEFTCVPADLHGLQAQFDNLPWTKTFAHELGAQLVHALAKANDQTLEAPAEEPRRRAESAADWRWKKLGERGPFPHP